jgi:hypothetical protein
MLQRWKDELVLVVILIVCAVFGGYFGAKLSQMNMPGKPATYHRAETFGQPPSATLPTVIVIVVHDSPTRGPESATYRMDGSLNPIQSCVNFI